MSSNQTGTGEPRPRVSRVIKSGTDVGMRFAFPALEQVTSRDLPPSLIEEVPATAAGEVKHPVHAHLPLRSEAAAEAEARARALERRAAAVLAEAEEAAASRVQEAEQHATAMLAEAEEGVNQIRAEARERGVAEGHAEGYQQGLEAARSEADALLAEAQSAALSIREGALAERARLLDDAHVELLQLAFAVARQVLKAELSLNPAALLPMVAMALAKLKGEEEPQVRVSPAMVALLEEQRGRLLAAIPGARRIGLEGDPGLADGDFLVQGAQGFVDGRIDRQLAVLESEVTEEER